MDTSRPIRKVAEGVSNFYRSGLVGNALERGLYHGNLVIFGPWELIESESFERYPALLDVIKKKAGAKGYDDPDRLGYAMRRMSLFSERGGNDRDGAIAISGDDYSIMRAGGYVKRGVVHDDVLNQFLEQASEYKGGKVNGRHISGFNFSRLTDDGSTGAVIASTGGSSIVTVVGDRIVPNLSQSLYRE